MRALSPSDSPPHAYLSRLCRGWWTELGPDWMVEAFREASRHTGGKLMIAEHGVGLPGPRTNALVALVKSLMRKGAKVDGVALRLRLRVREDPGMLLRALREDRASGPEPATPPYSPSPHGKEYMATQRGPGAVVFDWEAWRATVRQQLTRVGDMEQRQAHALAEEMEAAVHNATAEGSDPGAALADALSDLILPALGVGRGGGEAGNLTVDSLLPLTDPQGGDPAADGSGSGSSSGAGAGAVGEATRRALALQLSRILGQAVYHFEADIPAPTGAAAAAAAMSQATGMRGGVADTAVGTEAADEAAARAESASEEQQLEGIVADEMRRESEAAAEDGAEGAEGGEGEGSEGEGGGSGSGNEPTFEPLFDYGALWDRSPHSGPEHRDHSPGGLSTFSRFMRPPVPRPSTDAAAAPGGDAGGAPPAAVVDQAEEGEGSDEALTPSDLGLPRLGGAESGGDGAFSLPGVLLEVAASVRDGAGALPAFPPPRPRPAPRPACTAARRWAWTISRPWTWRRARTSRQTCRSPLAWATTQRRRCVAAPRECSTPRSTPSTAGGRRCGGTRGGTGQRSTSTWTSHARWCPGCAPLWSASPPWESKSTSRVRAPLHPAATVLWLRCSHSPYVQTLT